MDIPIYDGDQVPQPKENVRIEALDVLPYPDRFRVYVHIRVTPFLERPNLLLVARDADGKIVTELNVIETMHHDMEFTMHLRGLQEPSGDYTLDADVFYETRNPPTDRRSQPFTVPEADSEDEA